MTAADNALKFKNTAMENASASTMTLCFIFAAAFGITLFDVRHPEKTNSFSIYVLLASAEQIEQGNLEEEITYASRDEFGELADSFRQMQASLKSVIADERQILNAWAAMTFAWISTRTIAGNLR